MEQIMVSICCATYNQEKYIRQCLDSFLMQKCSFKFEVIVRDDASIDSTAEIIREYQEKYPDIIKPIFEPENKYSKGEKIYPVIFKKAVGKYIAMCDADDYWIDPYKLQKQFDVMEQNPDCHICLHKVKAVDEIGNDFNLLYPNFKLNSGVIKGKNLIKYTCMHSVIRLSSYFMRATTLNEYIYPNIPEFFKVAVSEDTPLLLFFGHKGNMYYSDDIMSCYRKNSVSSIERTKDFSETEECLMKHYKNQLQMIKLFDEYTDYKYHKFCIIKNDAYYFDHFWRLNDYRNMAKWKYRYFLWEFDIKAIAKVYIGAIFPKLFDRK